MGDADSALQSSKKRAAGREISRENPGLDDEEDSPEQETGTFKRASDEVLATRRIVKVRRQPPASAPSSNPFAGIKLIAPTESITKSEVTTEVHVAGEKTVSNDVDGKTKSSNENKNDEEEDNKQSEENNEAESKTDAEPEPESKTESAADEQNSGEEKSNIAAEEVEPVAENEAAAEEDKTENDEKKDGKTESKEKKDESAPLSSFQQLSSSQNAFTNLSGTGFSTSTFSFGSIASDGSTFGTGSGSLFGLKTDQPSFGFGLSNNGSSSLFGTSNSYIVSKSEGSSTPAMKEIEVETGEENEEVVFNADSVLYEFIDGGWKERGKGEVKINISKPEKDKARLVMRARGNYRLILNASLFPDMKLTTMDKKGLSFACMNSTGDGKGVFSTFALKFKDPSIAEEFRVSVIAHKGKAANSAVLKTPENSPKASDE